MINKRIFILVLFLVAPLVSKANTYITDGNIVADTVFTVSGSPYILNDYIRVYPGVRLTIQEGVELRIGTSTEEDFYPSISLVNSILDIQGTKDKRVKLNNIGIYSDQSNIYLGNTDMEQSGLFITRSKAKIFNSTFSQINTALYSRLSDISIDYSIFRDNSIAIEIGPDKIFQATNSRIVKNGFDLSFGGEGNATMDFIMTTPTTSLSVRQSIFENNTNWSVHNMSEYTFDFRENWWGQSFGPENKVTSNIDFDPWLHSRPVLPLISETKCCSSIIFIPGIESSRLKSTTTIGSRIRLWEPISNIDVERLFLDSKGMSLDEKIYSDELVDSFLGIYNIYKDFIGFLGRFAKEKALNDFVIYPYDWRRDVRDIVLNGDRRATSTDDLISLVKRVASNSKTGKVTIIAHSNGGLIAKELAKELEKVGETNLIDKVVSIAVPYLGTPKAIFSLLHGFDQSIFGGFVMSQSTARSLAQNMYSAYNLLPSPLYFKEAISPVIMFSTSSIPNINDGSYPLTIQNYTEQMSFIDDVYNVRKEPDSLDTKSPIIGNRYLSQSSRLWRNSFDTYHWPSSIANYALVGLGQYTSSDLTYSYVSECSWSIFTGLMCGQSPKYKVGETKYGDGTVIAHSAAYDASKIISLNLNEISKIERKKIVHANITESSTTQSIIRKLLSDTYIDSMPGIELGLKNKALYEKDSRLVVSTHSPVSLHIYDSEGRHTGLSTLPKGIDSNLYSYYEENIPDSHIEVLGDGTEKETYISLPNDDDYRIEVLGEGIGSFTLNAESYIGNEKVSSLDFVNIPVVPTTQASTTLHFDSTSNILSTSTTLVMDIDSDGINDLSMKSGQTIDDKVYLKLLKKSVKKYFRDEKRYSKWQDKMDKFIERLDKGKKNIKIKKIDREKFKIGHKISSKLTNIEKDELAKTYEYFIDSIE